MSRMGRKKATSSGWPRMSAKCQIASFRPLANKPSFDQFVGYSITLLASTRNDSGIVSPSALAVLRLTTSSNFGITAEPVVHADVLSFYPSRLLHRFPKLPKCLARDWIVRAQCVSDEYSDVPHSVWLLRSCGEWPSGGRATE